jgi:3-dehydroshikimate dehydratase
MCSDPPLTVPPASAKNARMRPGLVSVTFRLLPPEQIVQMVSRAGLAGIEWGGDVHVPHGDLARARDVARMTHAAGLEVAAYGSYYRVHRSEEEGLSFPRVLDTARELGAPCIRVWAGTVDGDAADEAHWAAVVDESLRIADLAAEAQIRIAVEFHGGTLTSTNATTQKFLERAAHLNLWSLWQPLHGAPVEENVAGIGIIGPRLQHAHVFHWWPTPRERYPLAAGAERWAEYIRALRQTPARWALLEFVKGDAPEQFEQDAATLLALLRV